MKQFSYYKRIIILAGALITALMLWFAISNYRNAEPVSKSILRGLALSFGQAVESLASKDKSFKSLSDFHPSDIAYFSLIDRDGVIRFHSNPDLVGETVGDSRFRAVLENHVLYEEMVRLGTGETVYETQQEIHLASGSFVLRMALHTWQADQVILRARSGLTSILILLASSWGMGVLLLRMQQRDARRREELARNEHLARLGEMGAILAHEVRTPLAGIKGYAQLLQEKLSEPRLSRHAEAIVSESARLEKLVSDLLAYSRRESSPGSSAVVEDDVYAVWQNILAANTDLSVSMHISGAISGKVACAPEHLRQIFVNIFSNSIEAMNGSGEICISLSDDGRMAAMNVRDTGPGFPDDAMERLFDPFFTTRASGTGLGLAVCRKIAEGYGGSIEAANSSGGGAELMIKLPLSRREDER